MRYRENRTDVSVPIVCGTHWKWATDGPPFTYWWHPVTTSYMTTSTGYDGKVAHNQERCWDQLHPGPPYLTGGPFTKVAHFTNQYEVKTPDSEWSAGTDKYVGHFRPLYLPSKSHNAKTLSIYESSLSDLSAEGPSGWNKFRPAKPSANLGQFLAELRETPRMLMTTADAFRVRWRDVYRQNSGKKAQKAAANHWLNTQFGWLPFVSDLRKFIKTSFELEKRMKRISDHNGKWQRRGGTMVEEDDGRIFYTRSGAGLQPILGTSYYNYPYGKTSYYVHYTRKVWFKAKFRYYLKAFSPEAGKYGHIDRFNRLYGLELTPSLVWELIPWSWLSDWCNTMGDSIANSTAINDDDLAAKYAYIMETVSQRIDTTGTNYLKSGAVSLTASSTLERKKRVAASPFGFGLSFGDFSPRRLSILGALGLSRLRY